MKSFLIRPASSLKGQITPPGDKSIACRSVIISSIASGKTTIQNFPSNLDCLCAVNIFKKLGVKITQATQKKHTLNIFGKGLYGLKKPKEPVFVGDSGTTLRLTLGVLAGQNFRAKLVAGKSLTLRPMHRVTEPLRMMGAKIGSRLRAKGANREEYPPIIIKGGELRAITYKLPVASAQVKSAVILASLYARGRTQIIEPVITRDHTERMLKLFKAGITVKKNKIFIKGNKKLISSKKLYIPGDISSASFFMVCAAILPDSEIRIKNVSLNPFRAGIIKVLKRMSANVQVSSSKLKRAGCEPMGDIVVKSSCLRGTVVREEEIPSLIDELPILMVAAACAKGKTIFKGVSELRVKETDRIRSMFENLQKMGVNIKVLAGPSGEDIVIEGAKVLKGAKVRSFGDHRTAMSMIVAGLKANSNTIIDDIACINKSFPDFLDLLTPLIR